MQSKLMKFTDTTGLVVIIQDVFKLITLVTVSESAGTDIRLFFSTLTWTVAGYLRIKEPLDKISVYSQAGYCIKQWQTLYSFKIQAYSSSLLLQSESIERNSLEALHLVYTLKIQWA